MKTKNNNEIVISFFEYFRLACVVFVCVIIVTDVLFPKREIQGTSMEPILHDQETVFLNGLGRFTKKIERFDIVVVRNGEDELVKRVIGLPNEQIEYRKGILYINKIKVSEPFLNKSHMRKIVKELDIKYFTNDYKSGILGYDEYFVVGDNRNISLDSRSFTVGPIKKSDIIANGMILCKSWNDFMYIGN